VAAIHAAHVAAWTPERPQRTHQMPFRPLPARRAPSSARPLITCAGVQQKTKRHSPREGALFSHCMRRLLRSAASLACRECLRYGRAALVGVTACQARRPPVCALHLCLHTVQPPRASSPAWPPGFRHAWQATPAADPPPSNIQGGLTRHQALSSPAPAVFTRVRCPSLAHYCRLQAHRGRRPHPPQPQPPAAVAVCERRPRAFYA
jgi:hypothetical protein